MVRMLKLLLFVLVSIYNVSFGFPNGHVDKHYVVRKRFLFPPRKCAFVCGISRGQHGIFRSERRNLLPYVEKALLTTARKKRKFRRIAGFSNISLQDGSSTYIGDNIGASVYSIRRCPPEGTQPAEDFPSRNSSSARKGLPSANIVPRGRKDSSTVTPANVYNGTALSQFPPLRRSANQRLPLGIPIADAAAQSISLSAFKTRDTRNRLLDAVARGARVALTVNSLGSFLMPETAKLIARRKVEHEGHSKPKEFLSRACDDIYANSESGCLGPYISTTSQSSDNPGRLVMRFRLLQQLLLPHSELPEIAVAGRSNVGKSSLLNAFFDICNHSQHFLEKKHTGKQITRARTSKTPGRTRAIDMYQISRLSSDGQSSHMKEKGRRDMCLSRMKKQPDSGLLILADFPGYGHTEGIGGVLCRQISLTLKVYIEHRQQLKHMLVLVDGRRGLNSYDHDLLKYLHERRIPATLVITKCDTMDAQMIQDIVCNLSYLKRVDIPQHLSNLRINIIAERTKDLECNEKECDHLSGSATRPAQENIIPFEHRAQLPIGDCSERASNEQRVVHPSRRPIKVFLVSARTGEGVQQLWRHILQVSTEAPSSSAISKTTKGSNDSRSGTGATDTAACLPEDIF